MHGVARLGKELCPVQQQVEPVRAGQHGPFDDRLVVGVGEAGERAFDASGLGAMLLDLEDPSRVVARLQEPLITPNETEREGYVPNVVYTCGVLQHRENLIIPYAMSDSVSGIATVSLDDLMAGMQRE